MRKILLLLSLAILLEGCVADPVLNTGTPGMAIIGNCYLDNQAENLRIAQKHCEGYGKNAVYQPDNRPDGYCSYECK